jgi:hypothetical protein
MLAVAARKSCTKSQLAVLIKIGHTRFTIQIVSVRDLQIMRGAAFSMSNATANVRQEVVAIDRGAPRQEMEAGGTAQTRSWSPKTNRL